MTAIKYVVNSYRSEQGTFSIRMRIYANEQRAYISTPYKVSKEKYKRKKITDPELVNKLNISIVDIRKQIEAIPGSKDMTAKQIVAYLSYNKKTDSVLDLFQYAGNMMRQLEKTKRNKTAAIYTTCINSLKKYVETSALDVNVVTAKFLRGWELWMRNKGTGTRGIESNMQRLRAIINRMRADYNDEELGDETVMVHPFDFYKIPKSDTPEKRALSVQQLKAIRDVELKPKTLQMARDMFMLSFYLVGINSIDLHGLKPANNGRISYCRSKVMNERSDKAYISIKLEPEAQRIIDRYNTVSEYLVNAHQRYNTPANFNKLTNRYLKVIGNTVGIEGLQYYAARHTWATIAANVCCFSMADIAFALNHSEGKLVTYRYIKRDFSKIDIMNRAVIDAIK